LRSLEVPDHLLLPQAGDFLHGFPIGSGDPTVRDIPGRVAAPLKKIERVAVLDVNQPDNRGKNDIV